MKTNPNEPISPIKGMDGTFINNDEITQNWIEQCNPLVGLTKREYFAGLAMQGLCLDATQKLSDIAGNAVYLADSLIKELNEISK